MSSLPLNSGDTTAPFAVADISASEALLIVDSGQNITLFNGSAERMFGRMARNVVGQPFEHLFASHVRSTCRDFIRSFVESHAAHSLCSGAVRLSGLRANGEEFPVEVSVVKFGTDTQTTLAVLVRDTTARNRAEALSQGQNEVLQMIVQNKPLNDILAHLVCVIEAQSPDMLGSILLLDSAGVCLRHGAAPNLPLEYSKIVEGHKIGPREGSCGTAAYRRAPVYAADVSTDPVWEPYRGIPERYGLRSCWSTPIFSGDGRLLGTFAMYHPTPRSPTLAEMRLIDVATRFASIAIERSQAESSLRAAEDKYRRIFEGAVEGVFQSTVDGRLLTANPALARMLGYDSPSSLIAEVTDIERQLHVSPDRWAEFHQSLQANNAVTGFEFQLRRRDGKVIWVSENAHGVRDPSGRILYYEGTMLDVTERKELEGQLRQAQKMEALGHLAGGVAHDFNNLLTVINAHADLVLGAGGLGAEAETAIREIHAAGHRATALTRQLLMFSRKQVLRVTVIDLNEVVRGVVKMLDRVIGENVRVELKLADALPSVMADPGMAEQVLVNLALNARDAMSGGGTISIATEAVTVAVGSGTANPWMRPGDFVRLTVRDTGTGIPADVLPHIFEPFFTTKDATRGSGLGLATVFGIMQQHRGWIDVASKIGNGAAFSCYWPAELQNPAEPPDATAATLPIAGTETVLLVEDELAVRTVAAEILRRLGYTVLAASSGVEALEVWQQQRTKIDVLVTDEIMPGKIRGTELAERFTAEKASLAVVCTSGYTGRTDTPTALGSRTRHLPKPYTVQSLCLAVRQALDAVKT